MPWQVWLEIISDHLTILNSTHFTKGAVSQSSATNVESQGENQRQNTKQVTAYFHHTDGNEIPPFTSPWMWKDIGSNELPALIKWVISNIFFLIIFVFNKIIFEKQNNLKKNKNKKII